MTGDPLDPASEGRLGWLVEVARQLARAARDQRRRRQIVVTIAAEADGTIPRDWIQVQPPQERPPE